MVAALKDRAHLAAAVIAMQQLAQDALFSSVRHQHVRFRYLVGDAAYLYMLLQGRETYGREHLVRIAAEELTGSLTPMEREMLESLAASSRTDQDIDIQYTPEELWALEQMAGKLRYAVLTELANADPELARLKANDIWLLGTSKLTKPAARAGELRKLDEETV